MLYEESQRRILREYDDLLLLISTGVREGMTDVYVALKRLKRKGKPVRVLPDRHKRAAPTFDALWARMDLLARQFPDRVKAN